MITKQIKTYRYEAAAIWSESVSFPAHAHDEFVLSCNIKGHERLKLDGRQLEAPEFSTTLYNPGQIQSGIGTELISSVYLDQSYVQEALHEDREIVFDRYIVEDMDLFKLFAKTMGSVLTHDEDGDLEDYINAILLLAAERYSNRVITHAPKLDDWRVQYVLNWLKSDLSGTPSLETMAAEVGLSKTAFLRMFKKAVGTTPSQWHRTQRVAEAKNRLRSGDDATKVAVELGFYDQAHLIKHFRQAYGVTPGHYTHK
ncbi:AraC family transcriptional regulator, chemosensory pili system protein ChpD [Cohaesibacter sp. ES.047]|uniref:helix-turn-helix domain-containing protein n=1 Tax=Cohaesibacter sp. ES.047 TaxID=1798205 RepID=UPI000BB70849|nr:AraC family transcriptional regulator [Cohaesibacter sp. ES.047]SNY91743.1 AraC family transcriptional regulator, chemosensory pili system protein ChpD [Cohaesibacter sp. ES.047]